MAKYSKTQINKAGKILKDKESYTLNDVYKAEDIITYWRLIHSPLITTFQALIRTKTSKRFGTNVTIAQRLKRAPSILYKLIRYPNMQLSTMQDIAGIRAITENVSDVYRLKNELIKSKTKHKFLNEVDYVLKPKESGYRSIHLIFQYNNPKISESNELKIEVQVRSRLQHIWATAVETMGTFLETSLKSSEGPKEILDFFAFTSSAFAIQEKTSVLEQHKDLGRAIIFESVINQFNKLAIRDKLNAFAVVVSHISNEKSNAKFYLLTLDLHQQSVTIRPYEQNELKQANIDYTETERHINAGANLQVVLVSLESINGLKKAYPNYFLDTKQFIRKIEAIIESKKRANS
jgi:putative GTP pyrophosphokinase